MSLTATKFSSWLSKHKLTVHQVEDRYTEEVATFEQLKQKFITDAGFKPKKKGTNEFRCPDCDFRTKAHDVYGDRVFAVHRKYHQDLEGQEKSVENLWVQGKRMGTNFLFPCAYCDEGEHQSYKDNDSMTL